MKYLLPYRIDNEPITEWRDSVYYHRYRFAKGKNIWLGLSDYQDYIQAKILMRATTSLASKGFTM